MIEVNERVEVPAAPPTVWALLSNPHAVVDCVSGAKLGEQHEDGSYDASLTVKFGPAKVTFNTRVALTLDEAARIGNVVARGKDDKGGTRVRASMTFRVQEQESGTGSAIPIEAKVEISGRLALIVESGASLVVKRMTADFSERVAARCSAAPTGQQ